MTLSLRNILLAVLAVVIGSWAVYALTQQAFGASFPDPREGVLHIASSTTYTAAYGASARVIATSTAPGARTALSFQTYYCTSGAIVYLNFNDKNAATTTTITIAATSTLTFGDQMPMVYGSIRAVGGNGSCNLVVTEFRSPI